MKTSRRRLLSGAGAIGGAAVLGEAGRADAAPLGSDATADPRTTPSGIVPISSPPESGISYRFASWVETSPLNDLADGRVFSAPGAYTGAANDLLGTTFDLPPGAIVHDVEIYCSAQVNTHAGIATWSTGQPNLSNAIAGPVAIGPFPDSAVRATRIIVPTASNGPFPHGTKLVVYLTTLTTGTVGLNGFRVGLKNAPLGTVLLPAPARVYDTRTAHRPISGGASHTISLASHLPVGANGALYTVSVINTHSQGGLRGGPAGSTAPTLGLQWARTGDRVSAPMTTAMSSNRSIKIQSAPGSGRTDFYVDLTGYLV